MALHHRLALPPIHSIYRDSNLYISVSSVMYQRVRTCSPGRGQRMATDLPPSGAHGAVQPSGHLRPSAFIPSIQQKKPNNPTPNSPQKKGEAWMGGGVGLASCPLIPAPVGTVLHALVPSVAVLGGSVRFSRRLPDGSEPDSLLLVVPSWRAQESFPPVPGMARRRLRLL